ncbi:MAG: homoserine dehydrogenase [bacterium]
MNCKSTYFVGMTEKEGQLVFFTKNKKYDTFKRMKKIKLGLIGLGTVGTGVIKIFNKNKELIENKLGVNLEIKKIVDLDITTNRGVDIDPKMLTTKVEDVISDPEIEIVISLVGGIHPEQEFILSALKNKKHIVTANKALLAKCGKEIFDTAYENGVRICFEASAGGGIPIIRSLGEGLAANRIKSIFGILNGTANFILTKMQSEKKNFKAALNQARELGYAEADPTLDIEGIDTAHKLSILSSMAFGQPIPLDKIYCEGISQINTFDIEYADEFGYCIKLLAIAKDAEKGIETRVHPTMLPKDYLLSSVDGVFNAIYINGDSVGPTMYYGQGAGQMPTASAVWSDIMELINKKFNSNSANIYFEKNPKNISDINNLWTKYYLRFSTLDQPGVLSKISGVLGAQKISIASVLQKERSAGNKVPIVMLTHEACEADMQKALAEINKLDMIKDKTVLIRIEK